MIEKEGGVVSQAGRGTMSVVVVEVQLVRGALPSDYGGMAPTRLPAAGWHTDISTAIRRPPGGWGRIQVIDLASGCLL